MIPKKSSNSNDLIKKNNSDSRMPSNSISKEVVQQYAFNDTESS